MWVLWQLKSVLKSPFMRKGIVVSLPDKLRLFCAIAVWDRSVQVPLPIRLVSGLMTSHVSGKAKPIAFYVLDHGSRVNVVLCSGIEIAGPVLSLQLTLRRGRPFVIFSTA